MSKVLVVDDEENIRKTLKEILEDEHYDVILAEDGQEAVRTYLEELPDVVLLDIQLPKKDGLTVLEEIKSHRSGCEVIMISGHGTIESAVRAIKLGAYHFLEKPLSLIQVKQIVRHAVEAKRQRDEISDFRNNQDTRYHMIGISDAMESIRRQIDKVAPTNGRVLITGESGTGKEALAYWIHRKSLRKNGPFVKINCAAIPQNLIESELFGHEKGSFTGAVAQKKGKFEMANGGTLFLDEIGDMDMSTQTRVLRIIQEGEFERVGGVKTIRVDVRIVSATHRNLPEMIEKGSFREDLFYRLNVVPIYVVPLSDRPGDIPFLAEHFLDTYCKENGIPKKKFSQESLRILSSQRYPGNIRELRNIVERLAIMCDGPEINADSLAPHTDSDSQETNSLFIQPRSLTQAKDELERMYVKTQLELAGWDISKTAEILGIQRTNLHRKIRQLDIEKK